MRNTGDVVLTGVSVDDTVLGHIGTIPALGVDSTVNLEKEYTVLPGSADVTNAVKTCVIGAPGLGSTELCGTDSHTLDVIHPAILVGKTAAPTVVRAGAVVGYSYAVTNPGDVALSGVTVTDDKCGTVAYVSGDTDGDQKLDPGESWLYRCSAPITTDTLNTAVATGIPPVGLPVTGTNTAFVDVVNPLLQMAKTGPAGAREGDTVTYNFVVSNIGDVPLTGISVDDDILGNIGTIPNLAKDASVTLHKDYVIPTGHPADVVNLASACVAAAPEIGNVAVCDSAPHTLDVLHPDIDVVKTVDRAVITAGSSVTYTYAVTNTGDTPLDEVSVTDDKCSPLTFSGGDTDQNNVLNLGETWTYRCSATLSVDTLNTATATGDPPVGPDVTGTATTLVDVVNPFLHVDKKAPAEVHEGETITYTFTVANTGDVALTNLSVVDDVLGPIGTIESLAPGTSVDLTKQRTVPAPLIGDLVNSVTVCTGGPAPGAPEDGKPLCDTDIHVADVLHPALTITKTADPVTVTGSGPVTFTYVVTNTGDAPLTAVTVTDDILGLIGNVPSLGAGKSVTLTKTVTIGANSALRNVGTASGTDSLGRTVTDDVAAEVSLVTPPADVLGVAITKPAPPLVPAVVPAVEDAVLPRTGSGVQKTVSVALALLSLGMGALFAGLCRRTSRRTL